MKRILVIEDDRQLSSAYQLKFSKDYIVDIAEDGNKGLLLFKEDKPDIVILDIMLPGDKNGFDVLNRIKKDPDQAKTPVIVLTNLESESHSALEMGAMAYIVKANANLVDLEKLIQDTIGK